MTIVKKILCLSLLLLANLSTYSGSHDGDGESVDCRLGADFDIFDVEKPSALAEGLVESALEEVASKNPTTLEKLKFTLTLLASPEKIDRHIITRIDGENIPLLSPNLQLIAQALSEEAEPSPEIIGAAMELFEQIRISYTKIIDTISPEVFFGKADRDDLSCPEVQIEGLEAHYAGVRPPLSRICPIYKSIVYTEFLLDNIMEICLWHAVETATQEDIYAKSVLLFTKFIEYRQNYAKNYAGESEDKQARFTYILDIHEELSAILNDWLEQKTTDRFEEEA